MKKADIPMQAVSKYNAQVDNVGAPTGVLAGPTGTAVNTTLIAQLAVTAAVV